MSDLSLPIAIQRQYQPWLDTNINEICYTELRQLQLKFDTHRDAIRDLAAIVPNTSWNSNKISEMLYKECPGEELLSELGVLNKNLREVIAYMQRIEFWPGLEIFLQAFPPLLQRDLPRQATFQRGEPLVLQCKSAAVPAPIYQWYYYVTQNPTRLNGERKPTLTLSQADWLNGKTVICSICNVHGQTYTSPCEVTIDTAPRADPEPMPSIPRPIPEKSHGYKAKDKVALLIGNGKYMSEKELTAPPNDILQIGQILKRMNFKTLICKDLTKASMENVLSFFVDLIIEDSAYGVLYFAGHGFETDRGNSYLVPSDSPTDAQPSECVSVITYLNKMLKRKPSLCLVVLDICRVRKGNSTQQTPPVESNSSTMVVFATNEGRKAYEVQGSEPLSVFASHLLKFIQQPISLIELMMQKVLPSIDKDQVAKKHDQRAEVQVTLSSQRSLHDPIDHSGATTKFQKSLLEWESVNRCPELMEWKVPRLGVKVKMIFTHEYSNSLKIYIGCIKIEPAIAFMASAHVSIIETTTVTCKEATIINMSEWPKIGFFKNMECMSVTENILNSIENLEGELIIGVTVEGSRQDGERVTEDTRPINLKRPLLAKLNFDNRMKGRRVPLKVPVQHEEDTAVEDDESYYTPVAVEQNSYRHGQEHP